MYVHSIVIWLMISIFAVLPEAHFAYRILGIFPHIGKSHHYAFEPLMKGLAKKGHEVTMITHFPAETPIENYRDISLKGSLPIWFSGFTFEYFELPVGLIRVLRHIHGVNRLFGVGYKTCKAMLENKEVQAIKEGDYDVVLIEQFNTDCGLGIAYKLKVPFIGVTSHSLMMWTNSRFDFITNPAYVPSTFLEHGRAPGFFGRVEAFVLNIYFNIIHNFWSQKPEHELLKQYFGNDLPPLEDIARNMSLVLVNTYFSLTTPVPRSPNHVEMAGFHLEKKNNISPELMQYLDNSKNGVIVFSMGSMMVASSWPDQKLKAFQEAFAELPQNILWKWDNETMPGASKNIKLIKWIPQFDVLHHKNIKAFITHAGMLGTIEAVYCGIPMLNIPIYGDQFSNAAAVSDCGMGVYMDYFGITKESVLAGLKKILEPKMQDQAKKMSAIWNDRPMPPLDTAIYWIEHVARHGGEHLRSPTARVPLYQYLLLDVITFLLVVLTILLYISYKLWKSFSSFINMCFTTKSKKD